MEVRSAAGKCVRSSPSSWRNATRLREDPSTLLTLRSAALDFASESTSRARDANVEVRDALTGADAERLQHPCRSYREGDASAPACRGPDSGD